jgi:hypothetical protein
MFCIECATELPKNARFCHICAAPQQQANGTEAVAAAKFKVLPPATKSKVSPEEIVFLEQTEVTVTNTRFIVASKTYAMAGVTSVGYISDPPKRGWPLAIGLIGGVCMLDPDIRLLGFIALLIAGLWLLAVKGEYAVVLTSASGEVEAVRSHDEQEIEEIVNAIEKSIVYRR